MATTDGQPQCPPFARGRGAGWPDAELYCEEMKPNPNNTNYTDLVKRVQKVLHTTMYLDPRNDTPSWSLTVADQPGFCLGAFG